MTDEVQYKLNWDDGDDDSDCDCDGEGLMVIW